ncbi:MULTISPECIES: transcriptional regulator [unclassified Novosphingobium]|uniref:transcriptional regulator n=1 Tax=unclassified Novosphingobium TaxID=2644732 RepID=UPI000A781BB8|nr:MULTISPECIES: YdaS family helix-turn-helix protein [unclassified Novosphingobium]MBN9143731.1 helix-turn-helix domain-containing protein [Novosphingobium sp.]
MVLHCQSDSALAQAIRKAGSQVAFGRIVGKRQSVIHDWLRKERPLPSELVFVVEAATGISRHDLRPDIYPRDVQNPPAEAANSDQSGAA